MKGLGAFTGLYKGVVKFKNYLYDEEYFQALELPIPVLSIGNLTMGGTGKTPLTDYCLKHYSSKNLKIAVISRNYRADVRDMAKVNIHRENAGKYYGDEPTMIAQKNPGVDVFVGPEKFETAQFALETVAPELLIIDDGFQHRKLHRDLDIVILDATEDRANYECVPTGRAREPFANLSRASAIVITKVNLVPADEVRKLAAEVSSAFGKPVFCFAYDLVRLIPNVTGLHRLLKDCRGMKCHLVSAIGRPETFEKSIAGFGITVAKHHVFSDHHAYSAEDVSSMIRELRAAGLNDLITTEKDFVKLKPLWPATVPLWVAPLEVHLQGQEDSFHEILDQILH